MFFACIPGHSGHVMVCVVNVVHLVQSEIQRQEETIDIAQYQSQLLGTFPAACSAFPSSAEKAPEVLIWSSTVYFDLSEIFRLKNVSGGWFGKKKKYWIERPSPTFWN